MEENRGVEKRPFFKKTDIIIFSILLIAVIGGLLFLRLRTAPQAGGLYANVSIAGAGDAAEKIYLSQNGIYYIEEGVFTVTLEVDNGEIRFINSQCPDHVCEGFGWLSREGDWAFCAPAGVSVMVEEQAN